MASYGRQADDETLMNYAKRIRARAIRRAGELYQQIESASGGDRRSTGHKRPVDTRMDFDEALRQLDNFVRVDVDLLHPLPRNHGSVVRPGRPSSCATSLLN
jgi:hypothetical protein